MENNYRLPDLYQDEKMTRVTLAGKSDEFILGRMPVDKSGNRKTETPYFSQLATRELEILSLLARGYTNEAIVDLLFTDVEAVAYHLNNMHRKLKQVTDAAWHERQPGMDMSGPNLKTMGQPITLRGLSLRLVPSLFN